MPLSPHGLLTLTPEGFYCRAAQAWIDAWRPVPRALITHAHADHARPGCGEYWATAASEGILRRRLGSSISLLPVAYGERNRIGEARVSFHSAGHVLGSAQIRLEAGGESWLVSGDYKRCSDPSCAPFETVWADVFITEAPGLERANASRGTQSQTVTRRGNRPMGLGERGTNASIGPYQHHGLMRAFCQLYEPQRWRRVRRGRRRGSWGRGGKSSLAR
jgi:hypothetical protein